MNYFVLVNGVLYLVASIHSIWMGHALWAVVWASYGVSALVLAALEG
jgi:hypothetical protein